LDGKNLVKVSDKRSTARFRYSGVDTGSFNVGIDIVAGEAKQHIKVLISTIDS
jgi:hypothetical protein